MLGAAFYKQVYRPSQDGYSGFKRLTAGPLSTRNLKPRVLLYDYSSLITT